MQKTSNYQLCQWDPEDRILREDFNSDNAKLDAALTGKLGRSQVIRSVTTEGGVRSISLRLDDIDWGEWEIVAFTFNHRPGFKLDVDRFYCNLNDGKTAGHNSAGTGGGFLSTVPYPYLLAFLPRHDAGNPVEAVSFGCNSSLHQGECTFGELKSILLGYSTATYLLPSMTLTLWGVR